MNLSELKGLKTITDLNSVGVGVSTGLVSENSTKWGGLSVPSFTNKSNHLVKVNNSGNALEFGTIVEDNGNVTFNGVAIASTPTEDTHLATKAYVDEKIVGINAKRAVKCTTVSNITLTGEQTIDEISIVAGDRVLVKNQSTLSQNGIYVASTNGWTRALDCNTWSSLVSAYVFVEEGTAFGDTGWVCTVNEGGTINSNSITWVQFSQAGSVTIGTIGSLINSATEKTALVDADMFGLMNSEQSNILYKYSWANVKAIIDSKINEIKNKENRFLDNTIDFVDYGVVVDNGANAYYPSVVFDDNAFESNTPYKFKCFYSTGTAIKVITSMDGVTWTAPVSCTGLVSTAHHPTVTYSRSGFGTQGSVKYKIWYWNSSVSNLLISTIRYAESVDGVTWTSDQAITQDSSLKIITGNSGDWNAGTWGFQKVFFNGKATNTGINPLNYSYFAYYDCNTGSTYQTTGLAYSIDGKNWYNSYSSPVINRNSGDSNAWDYYASSFGSFLIDINGYHCWYTGGKATTYTDNFGIGYAHSVDGITWTKDSNNPIFTVLDGLTYRNERCYTPSVVDDNAGTLYLFYTAQGSAQTGRKKLGLATLKYDSKKNFETTGLIKNDSNVTGTSAKEALNTINTAISNYNTLRTDTHFTTGFINRSSSSLSFTDNTRTFTIAPTSVSFDIYSDGSKINKTGGASCSTIIANTIGLHFIYFNSSGVLQNSMSAWNLISNTVPVALVFWNGTTGTICDERHSAGRDLQWHTWAHRTIGLRYESGLDGTFGNSTASLSSGTVADEDLIHTISTSTTFKIVYRNTNGSEMTFDSTASTKPYKDSSGCLLYDANGTLTSINSNQYSISWVYATNDITTPIYTVIGQANYTNLSSAQSASLPTLPIATAEWKLLYKLIYRNVNATTPTFVEASDYRAVTSGPVTNATPSSNPFAINIVTDVSSFNNLLSSSDTTVQQALNTLDNYDHGTFPGLSDDDHTQYALLVGRAGGQTLKGGTASGDDLTLQSTSNTTKGKIKLGTSVYNEATNCFGVGAEAKTGSKVNINTNTLQHLTFSSVEFAHGITDFAETDVCGTLQSRDSYKGGLQLYALSSTDVDGALIVNGVLGTDNPTDSNAAILIQGGKKNNTSIQALANTETILRITNWGNNLATILGNGYFGLGSSPQRPLHLTKDGIDDLSSTPRSIAGFFKENSSKGIYLGYDENEQLATLFPQGSSSGISLWSHNGSAWGERFRIHTDGNLKAKSKLQVDITPTLAANTFIEVSRVGCEGGGSNRAVAIGVYDSDGQAAIQAVAASTGVTNKVLYVNPEGGDTLINTEGGYAGFGLKTPNSIIQTNGAISTPLVTKTETYTITANDSIVLCDATSAGFTINLPTAIGIKGRQYVIKKIDSSSNTITIDPYDTQTIDGSSTKIISTQWTSVTLVSDDSNWVII